MTASTASAHRYRFGGPERVDWLGLQVWQGAVLFVAGVVLPFLVGFVMFLPSFVAVVAATFLAPPAVRAVEWWWNPARRVWSSEDTTVGGPRGHRRLPAELRGLRTVSVRRDDTEVGVWLDGGDPVVVMPLHPRGAVPLKGAAQIDRVLRGFGEQLEMQGNSGGLIAASQQYEITARLDPEALHRYWQDHRSPHASEKGTRNMQALLDAAAPASQEHHGLYAVRADRKQIAHLVASRVEAAKEAGELLGPDQAAALLMVEAAEEVAVHLRARCDTDVGPFLTADQLWLAVEATYDARARERRSVRRRLGLPISAAEPIPMREERATHLETPNSLIAVFRAVDYPAEALGDWLSKLVLGPTVARCISVAHSVLDPRDAKRELRTAIADTTWLDKLRGWLKKRKNADEEARDASLVGQELDLTNHVGSTLDRHDLYVTLAVTLGSDRQAAVSELRSAANTVERAAVASGIDLKVIKRRQAAAGTGAALPLARGVRPRLSLARKEQIK